MQQDSLEDYDHVFVNKLAQGYYGDDVDEYEEGQQSNPLFATYASNETGNWQYEDEREQKDMIIESCRLRRRRMRAYSRLMRAAGAKSDDDEIFDERSAEQATGDLWYTKEQLNPLHYDFDEQYSSTEAIDDRIVETLNPLFFAQSDAVAGLLSHGFLANDVDALISRMRSEIPLGTHSIVICDHETAPKCVLQFKRCARACDLLTWCMGLVSSEEINWPTPIFGNTSDACVFLQTLVEKSILIPLPYDPCARYEPDNAGRVYRFLQDDEPSASSLFAPLNVKPHTDLSLQQQLPLVSLDCAEIAMPPPSAHLFHVSVLGIRCSQLLAQIFAKFVRYPVPLSEMTDADFGTIGVRDQGYVDYQGIVNDTLFDQLIYLSYELRRTPVQKLSPEERKPFYVNMYNMLSLHALIVRGCESTERARLQFRQQDACYFLAGTDGQFKVSLDDIECGLLEGLEPLPYKQHLKQYMVEERQPDPRLHFVMSYGAGHCALPISLSMDLARCEKELEFATRQFVNSDLQLDIPNRVVTLGYLWKDHYHHFGNSELGVLRFVLKYASHDVRRILWEWLNENSVYSLDSIDDVEFAQRVVAALDFQIVFRQPQWQSQRKVTPVLPLSPRSDDTTPVVEVQDYTLAEVMASTPMRRFFRHFCSLEHSDENIRFAESVLRFRALSHATDMVQSLREIYMEFLREGAPSEINVSRRLVQEVESLLVDDELESKISLVVLDKLRSEIDIVLSDSFYRFTVSELYLEMTETMAEHKRVLAALQPSLVPLDQSPASPLTPSQSNASPARTLSRSSSWRKSLQRQASQIKIGLQSLVGVSLSESEHSPPTSPRSRSVSSGAPPMLLKAGQRAESIPISAPIPTRSARSVSSAGPASYSPSSGILSPTSAPSSVSSSVFDDDFRRRSSQRQQKSKSFVFGSTPLVLAAKSDDELAQPQSVVVSSAQAESDPSRKKSLAQLINALKQNRESAPTLQKHDSSSSTSEEDHSESSEVRPKLSAPRQVNIKNKQVTARGERPMAASFAGATTMSRRSQRVEDSAAQKILAAILARANKDEDSDSEEEGEDGVVVVSSFDVEDFAKESTSTQLVSVAAEQVASEKLEPASVSATPSSLMMSISESPFTQQSSSMASSIQTDMSVSPMSWANVASKPPVRKSSKDTPQAEEKPVDRDSKDLQSTGSSFKIAEIAQMFRSRSYSSVLVEQPPQAQQSRQESNLASLVSRFEQIAAEQSSAKSNAPRKNSKNKK